MTRVTLEALRGKLQAMALLRINFHGCGHQRARAEGYDLITLPYDDDTVLVGTDKQDHLGKFGKWLEGVETHLIYPINDTLREMYLAPEVITTFNAAEGIELDDHLAFIGDVLGKNIRVVTDARNTNSFGHYALKDDQLWYVHYMPSIYKALQGEMTFTRFDGEYHEIPDRPQTNTPVMMQFKVQYNLGGRVERKDD